MAGKYRTIHITSLPIGQIQLVTIPGFGPVAGATFKWVLATIAGTNSDDMGLGMGAVSFAGSGFQWACSSFSEDAVDPSSATKMGSVTAAIQLSNDDGTGAVLTGVVTQTTDGIKITWDTTPATAWHIEVTLYGGSTMQCEAGAIIDDASLVDTPRSLTFDEMSIEPEVLLFASPGVHDFGTTPDPNAYLSLGMGNAALEQGCWGYSDQNGRGPANRHGHRLSNTRVLELPNWSAAGTPIVALELTDTGVNGTPKGTFEVFKRVAGLTFSWGYFAFSTGVGQSSKIEAVLLGTSSTGSKSYVGSGFEPMLAIVLHTNVVALGGNNGNNAGGGPGSGSVDNQALREGSYSAGSQESDPSNTYSVFDSTLALQRTNGGGAGYALSLIEFTQTGFDYNVDVASSADKYAIILTLEVEPWGGIFWENICTEFDHTRTAQEIIDSKIWASDFLTSVEGQVQEAVYGSITSPTNPSPTAQDVLLSELVHEFNLNIAVENWAGAWHVMFQIIEWAP